MKLRLEKFKCSYIYIVTNAARMIAGIPNARNIQARMLQMMVATNANIKKSCGAG